MKKILTSILLIITILLPQLQGFAVNKQYEFIYMPTDDTYVYKVVPDANFGEEVLAKNDYQQSFISYLAFDLSGKTVILAYTADNSQIEELKGEISEVFENVKFIDFKIGSVVGSHIGPELAGIVFSDKYDFTDYED